MEVYDQIVQNIMDHKQCMNCKWAEETEEKGMISCINEKDFKNDIAKGIARSVLIKDIYSCEYWEKKD